MDVEKQNTTTPGGVGLLGVNFVLISLLALVGLESPRPSMPSWPLFAVLIAFWSGLDWIGLNAGPTPTSMCNFAEYLQVIKKRFLAEPNPGFRLALAELEIELFGTSSVAKTDNKLWHFPQWNRKKRDVLIAPARPKTCSIM